MSPRVRVLAIASLALLLASALALPEPSVYAGADWLRLHLLYKAYAKDTLSAGHLPLWNPWVALGRPFSRTPRRRCSIRPTCSISSSRSGRRCSF
jgi:hypothetical protein